MVSPGKGKTIARPEIASGTERCRLFGSSFPNQSVGRRQVQKVDLWPDQGAWTDPALTQLADGVPAGATFTATRAVPGSPLKATCPAGRADAKRSIQD